MGAPSNGAKTAHSKVATTQPSSKRSSSGADGDYQLVQHEVLKTSSGDYEVSWCSFYGSSSIQSLCGLNQFENRDLCDRETSKQTTSVILTETSFKQKFWKSQVNCRLDCDHGDNGNNRVWCRLSAYPAMRRDNRTTPTKNFQTKTNCCCRGVWVHGLTYHDVWVSSRSHLFCVLCIESLRHIYRHIKPRQAGSRLSHTHRDERDTTTKATLEANG